MPRDRRLRWGSAALAAGIAALYLFRLGRAGLYDLDEAVYAEIAREMLHLRDWVTPHLDGLSYLEKPPLHDWVTALALRAFGLNAWAARLPAALSAVAGILCVWWTADRLWTKGTGRAAGIVLATSFGEFIFGRMAMPDMLFSSLVTGTLCPFGLALIDDEASPFLPLVGWAAMAGAVMAKGLIGAILPGVALMLYAALSREWKQWRRLRPGGGAVLFFLLATPWHLLADARNPGFLRFYIVSEHIQRFLGHRSFVNYATLPVWLFLLVTFIWMSPWTVFFPAVALQAREDWAAGGRERRATQFVVVWAVGVIGFFCLSASRLEYYAVPALPALALLTARMIAARPRAVGEVPAARRRLLDAGWIALVIGAAALVPIALQFPWLEHHAFYNLFPSPQPAAGDAAASTLQINDAPGFGVLVPLLQRSVLVVLAGMTIAAALWFGRKMAWAWTALALTAAIGLAVVTQGFVRFEPYRSSVEMGRLLQTEHHLGAPIYLEGRFEHHAGLAFYSGSELFLWHGRTSILLNGNPAAKGDPHFVTDGEFGRRWTAPQRAYLVTEDPDRLADLRRLVPSTVAVARTGDNWLLSNRPEAGFIR